MAWMQTLDGTAALRELFGQSQSTERGCSFFAVAVDEYTALGEEAS